MIHTVRIRGFKRFGEVTLRLPGHVVLAGPNNTGKTTVLQAIASWSLAMRCWRELNDFNPRAGYKYAPIARQAFTAVPLRSFDLLWINRLYSSKVQVEVEIRHSDGWSVTMEFIADSTEQIYVRPKANTPPETLRDLDLRVVFVPPMTGIGIDEPVFQPPKIKQLLGLGRPGEVLRNLLAEANRDEVAWDALQASMVKLFGYKLLPPDTSGAHIRAEYRIAEAETVARPHLDIASAGSGFQQVLMLLAFLNTRPGAVLLLDEPEPTFAPSSPNCTARPRAPSRRSRDASDSNVARSDAKIPAVGDRRDPPSAPDRAPEERDRDASVGRHRPHGGGDPSQ